MNNLPTPQLQDNMQVRQKISNGITKLQEALFDQAVYESDHLSKLRNVVEILEEKIFDYIKSMKYQKMDFETDPTGDHLNVVLGFMKLAQGYMEKSVLFLERMHKLSADTAALMNLISKFNSTLDRLPKDQMKRVDIEKVQNVQGRLLDILSRPETPQKKMKIKKRKKG